jgi:uncharacterized NAD(P)/FAD-binding protein YdhS
MDQPVDIAVVGGGFTGTLLAILLRARLPAGQRILLFEPRPEPGRGPAYEEAGRWHVLNAPASGMSALATEPGHFAHWLAAQPPEAFCPAEAPDKPAARRFAPRQLYGRYMLSLLEEARRGPGAELRHVPRAVSAIRRDADGLWRVEAGATGCRARVCVLALGNAPAQPVEGACQGLSELHGLPPDGAVLLLGSGLTMVDHLMALRAQGHRGPVHVVSRHGWLPLPHSVSPPAPAGAAWCLAEPPQPPTIVALSRWLRREAARARAAGQPWQAVMDAVRPRVQALWRGLPSAERRRFLRHARTAWNLHRHRIAPEIFAIMREMVEGGQVVVHAARLEACAGRPDGSLRALLRRRDGRGEALSVARLLLCTGPAGGRHWLRHPVVAGLLAAGLARLDPLELGLDTAPGDAVLGRNGEAVPGLHAIGPCAPGGLWEITAVAEIRRQVADLAEDLAERLAPAR